MSEHRDERAARRWRVTWIVTGVLIGTLNAGASVVAMRRHEFTVAVMCALTFSLTIRTAIAAYRNER